MLPGQNDQSALLKPFSHIDKKKKKKKVIVNAPSWKRKKKLEPFKDLCVFQQRDGCFFLQPL